MFFATLIVLIACAWLVPSDLILESLSSSAITTKNVDTLSANELTAETTLMNQKKQEISTQMDTTQKKLEENNTKQEELSSEIDRLGKLL